MLSPSSVTDSTRARNLSPVLLYCLVPLQHHSLGEDFPPHAQDPHPVPTASTLHIRVSVLLFIVVFRFSSGLKLDGMQGVLMLRVNCGQADSYNVEQVKRTKEDASNQDSSGKDEMAKSDETEVKNTEKGIRFIIDNTYGEADQFDRLYHILAAFKTVQCLVEALTLIGLFTSCHITSTNFSVFLQDVFELHQQNVQKLLHCKNTKSNHVFFLI